MIAGTRHEAEGRARRPPDAIALLDRNPGGSGRSGRRTRTGRTDLRISGRRVHRVPARQSPILVRLVGRGSVQSRRNSFS